MVFLRVGFFFSPLILFGIVLFLFSLANIWKVTFFVYFLLSYFISFIWTCICTIMPLHPPIVAWFSELSPGPTDVLKSSQWRERKSLLLHWKHVVYHVECFVTLRVCIFYSTLLKYYWIQFIFSIVCFFDVFLLVWGCVLSAYWWIWGIQFLSYYTEWVPFPYPFRSCSVCFV